jgi:excisionase family DNA binding protein
VTARSARAPNGAAVRLALRLEEAAAAIGVSHDFFQKNVAHELRIVRRGRVRLVPIPELQKWLEQNASYAINNYREG